MKKEVTYLFETSYYKTVVTVCLVIALIPTAILTYFQKWIPIICILSFTLVIMATVKTIFGKDEQHAKDKRYLLSRGNKFDGVIIGFKRHKLLEQLTGQNIPGTENADTDVYTLIVQFDDTTFETPAIANNPSAILTTNKCTVYSDGIIHFATDFNTIDENFEIKEIKDTEDGIE